MTLHKTRKKHKQNHKIIHMKKAGKATLNSSFGEMRWRQQKWLGKMRTIGTNKKDKIEKTKEVKQQQTMEENVPKENNNYKKPRRIHFFSYKLGLRGRQPTFVEWFLASLKWFFMFRRKLNPNKVFVGSLLYHKKIMISWTVLQSFWLLMICLRLLYMLLFKT